MGNTGLLTTNQGINSRVHEAAEGTEGKTEWKSRLGREVDMEVQLTFLSQRSLCFPEKINCLLCRRLSVFFSLMVVIK